MPIKYIIMNELVHRGDIKNVNTLNKLLPSLEYGA